MLVNPASGHAHVGHVIQEAFAVAPSSSYSQFRSASASAVVEMEPLDQVYCRLLSGQLHSTCITLYILLVICYIPLNSSIDAFIVVFISCNQSKISQFYPMVIVIFTKAFKYLLKIHISKHLL